MKTIPAILILAGLASAQTPVMHNVLLTWQLNICSATVPAPCNPATDPNNGQAITYTFNVYKAPGACPAAGTDPKTLMPPFSSLATGVANPTYTDANALSAGQTWCYYVTVFTTDPYFGMPESGPSNYASATVDVPPTTLKAVVQ